MIIIDYFVYHYLVPVTQEEVAGVLREDLWGEVDCY